jgi:guanosine-3',5'-bis(diphosphate) 3'-pyrophosphohydrolase
MPTLAPIDDLIVKVRSYDPTVEESWLREVYEVADKAHEGQQRASGESYIEHPLAVARVLAEMEMDRATIAAALLHDVVEDT